MKKIYFNNDCKICTFNQEQEIVAKLCMMKDALYAHELGGHII